MRKIPFILKRGALVLIALALSATVDFGAAGLNGIYQVPGNFSSLTNAGGIFDALNTLGATGNITILITANLTGETGAVALNELAGGRTVTIKPDGAARTITGTGAHFTLINLNGADNVTIDGSLSGGTDRSLTISDGNFNGVVIQIFGTGNGANGNTVKNCIISGNSGTTISTGISSGGNDGVPNSNNVIRNNQIFRARDGVAVTRNDGATFDQNWIITGNSLGSTVDADTLWGGMLLGGVQNFTVSDNTITNCRSDNEIAKGIQFENAKDGTFSGNRMSGVTNTSSDPFTGGAAIGIYLKNATANITFSNNAISNVSAPGARFDPSACGIRIFQGGGYKFYYNSVNLSPSQSDSDRLSAALYIEDAVNTAGSIDLRDNILVNSKAAGTRYAVYNDSGAGAAVFSTIDYNDYFAQNVGYSGGATKVTLGDWKATTGQDAHSLSVNPSFYSATDLHITIDSPVRFAGTALPEVLVDFDGEIRFTDATDIGADEVTNRCYSFSETFDAVTAPALPTGWTTAASGGEFTWVTSAFAPASPPNDVFALEVGSVGVAELTSPVIAVPANGAYASFLNLYNLEQESATVGYDGMVLEISINGGGYADIITAGGAFLANGYTHTISGGFGSAIAGRRAWSGLSDGTTAAPSYKGTFVELPPAANGTNIQLKWRVACDSSTVAAGLPGVRIDNFSIFTDQCAAPAAHHFTVTAPANATVGSPFNFTVKALGQSNATASGYTGTVHFTSTDGSASLPANSTLTNGEGTFSATLNTGDNQTITATDTVTSSITGTSNTIAVPIPTPTATATATPTATATATPTATATATATPTPGLVGNVSTRLPVGTGDNVLIEGFIVLGPGGSTKNIIVRAIGPSLIPFGIADALANPTLEIHDSNNAIVATNDDWRTTQVGGIITGDQSQAISGSGVAPSNDLESAIIANLAPGSYTALVSGVGNTVGTGVVDAYDLSAGSPARLANIATRGLIQPGDKLMIAGFIIQNGPVRAVVRAIGPSLSAFGITNALPDTTLQLKDQNGTTVLENDDWQSSQKQELESTGLQPSHNLEAAVVGTIAPGQYTVQVRGKPESTGIGVVQVYFLQ